MSSDLYSVSSEVHDTGDCQCYELVILPFDVLEEGAFDNVMQTAHIITEHHPDFTLMQREKNNISIILETLT